MCVACLVAGYRGGVFFWRAPDTNRIYWLGLGRCIPRSFIAILMNTHLNDCDSISIRTCVLGRGIFAERDFIAGEFILRFTGPVITLEEALAKGETQANALQIGPETYIDAHPPGVFINHSCEPNSGIRNNLDLYALTPILRGQEICFDYSTTMSERCWTMHCRCGATSCRGVIRDFHELPRERQDRYISEGVVQDFIIVESQLNQN